MAPLEKGLAIGGANAHHLSCACAWTRSDCAHDPRFPWVEGRHWHWQLGWKALVCSDLRRMVLGPATEIRKMLGFGKDKKRQRFYLLPGMGGRARWRKEMMYLRWAIAAGLLVSAVVAGLLYLLSRNR
jgi:hypothetical protein